MALTNANSTELSQAAAATPEATQSGSVFVHPFVHKVWITMWNG